LAAVNFKSEVDVILFCLDIDAPAHPRTRHDIVQWTYFTDKHIYADNDPNNYRELSGNYASRILYIFVTDESFLR